jgi:hypothetical protein
MRTTSPYLHPLFIGPAYKAKKHRSQWRKIRHLTIAITILLIASIAIKNKAVAEPIKHSQTHDIVLALDTASTFPALNTQIKNSKNKEVSDHYDWKTLSALAGSQSTQPPQNNKTKTWLNLSSWLGLLCFMGYLLMHAIRNEP